MLRLIGFTLFLGAILLIVAFAQPGADGCAPVRRADRPEDYIRIAEESAIIVWDPVQKIEHFIRRAAFDTKSPDFGFLVPTPPGPELPKLSEVEDALFSEAGKWILPRVVTRTQYNFEPLMCMPFLLTKSAPGGRAMEEKKNSVRVLAEQKVGGYESAILEADNTESLAKWLKDKGYSNDPELQSWLVPYITEKWKITAFKIMQDPKTGNLATTKPVRMSFATERPFFPYREPEAKDEKQPNGPRLLRVYFVSGERAEGKLGNRAWHANIPWSDALTSEQRAQLLTTAGIAPTDLPAKAWMTTFEDHTSPRPGKDEVYFDPAKEQTPIRPPDIIHYQDTRIPADLIGLGVLFLALIGFCLIFRPRRKSAMPGKPGP